MNVNLKEDIKPISYLKTNALSIMKLIQISEKAIQDGKIYDNKEVFSELKTKLLKKKH
jgi:hypothetical protein